MTTQELLEESKKPFTPFVENKLHNPSPEEFDYELDSPGGCSESCEVY